MYSHSQLCNDFYIKLLIMYTGSIKDWNCTKDYHSSKSIGPTSQVSLNLFILVPSFSYFNTHVLIFGLIFHLLGFGLPLAFITSWPASHVVSGCVFSILFPLFIVSGNQAHVVTCDKQIEFRIFHPTVVISNAILTKTLHNNHSRQINRNQ